jgi:hypothetical protein
MKPHLLLIALLFLSCKNSKQQPINALTPQKEDLIVEATYSKSLQSEKKFLDSISKCENDQFTSVLEEIPNRDTNAYRITITSKKGNNKFTKILDTRPKMSQIHECNDLYTEVGFPCGGPCYSRVFVFTDKNRPEEQYEYVQKVKNNSAIIGHIKNEEFENLYIHNFMNSKEQTVDFSDINDWNYGQTDSMVIKGDKLILYYQSKNRKNATKTVKLTIL